MFVSYKSRAQSAYYIVNTVNRMAGVDNSWIFDSLLCFLNSPMWNTPLHNFIDEKSIVFEPTSSGKKDDKNETEYRRIHNEFKGLVDLMLGSYMEDYGITPEQFEVACSKTMQDKMNSEFTINSFEPIWAANDFEIFRRMMVHQNIELQIQALELLERKHGVRPRLFTMEEKQPRPSTSRGFMPLAEKQVMVEVIQKYETDKDKSDLRKNIDIHTEKLSLQKKLRKTAKSIALLSSLKKKMSGSEVTTDAESDADTDTRMKKKKKKKSFLMKKTAKSIALLSKLGIRRDGVESDPETERETKVKEKKKIKRTASSLALLSSLTGWGRSDTEDEERKSKARQDKAAGRASFRKTSKKLALLSKLSGRRRESVAVAEVATAAAAAEPAASDEDVAKRKEYLTEQRNRLAEMKKNVRRVQLSSIGAEELSRPASAAKVASDIVEGGQSMDEETLRKRRALAERLRTEVITSKIDEEDE